MMTPVNCRTDDHVGLEKLTEDHLSTTYFWVKKPEFRSVFLLRGEITWEGHNAYFSKVLHDPSQKLYAIRYKGEHVGNCGFKHLDSATKSGELWIYIGAPEMRGKGIGFRAVQLLLSEAVSNLGLERIQVHVAESNESARKIYLRVGFVDAGDAGEEWHGRDCRVLRMTWVRKSA